MSLDINKLMDEREQESQPDRPNPPFVVGERIVLPNSAGQGGWVGDVISVGHMEDEEYMPHMPPFDVTVVYVPNLHGEVYADFRSFTSHAGNCYVGFRTEVLRKLNKK